MDWGTETKAASWKITSTPRTASSTRVTSRTSPSRTSSLLPSNWRVNSSMFSRFPVLKLSRTRTFDPCSNKAWTICDPIKPAPPVTRYFILSPGPAKDRAYRPQDNGHIHCQGPMFDVVKIIFQLDNCFGHTGDISIIDLRPTGEPWLDEQTRSIEGNLLLIFVDQARSLCSWTDETHLAAQNRPELRQFIEARTSQETADTRHARVILHGCVRTAVHF